MKERTGLISAVVLIIVAALAYLPLINQIGYSHDDWYLMYSAGAYGPGSFWDIFSVDRPLRALVMIPAYSLFGNNPLYYGLSAYLFRMIGGLALLWSLHMLWPRQKAMAAMTSFLFVIYPGFLSQPNAIDYQSHLVGLAAALLSVACTLKAILSENRWRKVSFHILSILLGWLYLGQMEWYIGFEFFRWLSVFLLCSRRGGTLVQKGMQAFRSAYPSLVAPGVFSIWRIFFFQSERGATDVNLQFDQVKLYPIQTVYHWTVQVIQDLFDVLLNAWTIPLSQLLGYVQLWGSLIAFVAVALVLFVFMKQGDNDSQNDPQPGSFSVEALWLGFVSAAAGLIPIAMVNREVVFPSYSRYSLVSSVGAAIFIVGMLVHVHGRVLRSAILAALVFIAVLTHHANSIKYVGETAAVRNFWWQVSWRVPQLTPRTTLVGTYPVGGIEEDYFLWGPASLVYYPEKPASEDMGPTLFAAVLNQDTVTKILARERQEFDNRKNIITYKNYRNILILSQPATSSCVHVINGLQPEFSTDEQDSIRMIGAYSEIEHVLLDDAPHTPPVIVFGPEPSHGWCYYYQIADLARQRGRWEEVIEIGEHAVNNSLAPNDLIEWMPFLQAYAQEGNVDRLTELAATIRGDRYVSMQACRIIGSMQNVPAPVAELVDSQYCLE